MQSHCEGRGLPPSRQQYKKTTNNAKTRPATQHVSENTGVNRFFLPRSLPRNFRVTSAAPLWQPFYLMTSHVARNADMISCKGGFQQRPYVVHVVASTCRRCCILVQTTNACYKGMGGAGVARGWGNVLKPPLRPRC